MNIHSLMRLGTVEFRHHEGSLDPARMSTWALWCGWFVHLAAHLSDEEANEIRGLEDCLGSWKRPGWMFGVPSPLRKEIRGLLERDTTFPYQEELGLLTNNPPIATQIREEITRRQRWGTIPNDVAMHTYTEVLQNVGNGGAGNWAWNAPTQPVAPPEPLFPTDLTAAINVLRDNARNWETERAPATITEIRRRR